jgi:hypothetical protein
MGTTDQSTDGRMELGIMYKEERTFQSRAVGRKIGFKFTENVLTIIK